MQPGRGLLLIVLVTGIALAGESVWESSNGTFNVSYVSELQPVVINRMHRWTLIVEDSSGEPVKGAVISIEGGMPDHDHGLPTQPRITNETSPGRYVLEGLRFHMAGSWELVVTIESGDLQDTVVITLDVQAG